MSFSGNRPKNTDPAASMMKDSDSSANGIANLRRWITWAAVIGTALWAGYFFVFLIYQSIVGSSTSDNWFMRMVQEHPAATVGVAMSAITAFCLVALFMAYLFNRSRLMLISRA